MRKVFFYSTLLVSAISSFHFVPPTSKIWNNIIIFKLKTHILYYTYLREFVTTPQQSNVSFLQMVYDRLNIRINLWVWGLTQILHWKWKFDVKYWKVGNSGLLTWLLAWFNLIDFTQLHRHNIFTFIKSKSIYRPEDCARLKVVCGVTCQLSSRI